MNYLGRTIVDGEIKYASVSGVKLYDPRTKGGCPRRYFKRYVLGEREIGSDVNEEAKAAGLALDKELKVYLRTGSKAMSPLAIKGIHILETPGPDIGLDVSIHTTEYYLNGQPFAALPLLENGEQQKYPEGTKVIVRSPLTAGGVPFVGELDLVHRRGHWRDDEGEFHADPPGTVEVGDIKYKSNEKNRDGGSNLMIPSDLVRDIQMAGYGEWVSRVCPDATHVRLSLLYFPKKPAGALPSKVTRLHVLDDCHRTWEYVEGLVRDMQQVARETDVEHVPGNIASCESYGGCPHRATCSAYKATSLNNLFNKIATDHVQEKQKMGIIANSPGLMQQQGLPQATPAVTQQQLAAEEQQMRVQVAQQQQQMPTVQAAAQNTGADLLTTCYRLSQYGFGFPKLVGNAAMAYAQASGQNVAPGFEFQGVPANAGSSRSLHGLPLSEVAHIYQLDGELAAEKAKQGLPQIMPGAVDASRVNVFPQTQPQQVGVIVQGQVYQTAPIPQQFNPQPAPMPTGPAISFLAPNAPESMPALAQAAPPSTAPVEEKPKKKRGRPAATDSGTAPEAVVPTPSATQTAAPAQTSTPSAPPTQVTPAAAPTFEQCEPDSSRGCVLVNARFADKQTKSLAGYVDYINAELAKRYCVNEDGSMGVQDVRCPPKDSILAYGGVWGAVRAVVKADPPPQGDYHLDTFMDPLNEAVADALRCVAAVKGWIYVRGVRS
jgi:hypothetical protein